MGGVVIAPGDGLGRGLQLPGLRGVGGLGGERRGEQGEGGEAGEHGYVLGLAARR